MAKEEKKSLIVYAKDCIYSQEPVYELILRCDKMSKSFSMNWETGEITKENIVGCHSQKNCPFYKKR